jgi:hypothetical protein
MFLKIIEPYFARLGTVVGWTVRPVSYELVYRVKMDDGAVLQLTGDCLFEVKNYIDNRKAYWHSR